MAKAVVLARTYASRSVDLARLAIVLACAAALIAAGQALPVSGL